MQIDLNADMGEGFGAYTIGQDEALLGIVTSANVACGFHAGEATIMHRLSLLAKERGVGLGAHPGFNDLWGFGRRNIAMNARIWSILSPIRSGPCRLSPLIRARPSVCEGASARSITWPRGTKPTRRHRAGGQNRRCGLDPCGLARIGDAKGGGKRGLAFAREGFCDRQYREDGSLMPRSVQGSVIGDPAVAAAQALRFARDGEVVAAGGARLKLQVDTLCVHGDEAEAAVVARAVRASARSRRGPARADAAGAGADCRVSHMRDRGAMPGGIVGNGGPWRIGRQVASFRASGDVASRPILGRTMHLWLNGL